MPRPTATSCSASDLGPWALLTVTPARSALLVDLDGTLAPIVDDPAAARPLPDAVVALGALAGRLGRVAVVTGRPVAFVRRHLPDPAIVVVGQYGLERDDGHGVVTDPRAAAHAEAVAAAADDAARRFPGCTVERKGRLAVTLHWRTAPGSAPSTASLAAWATDHGLARFPGRRACELRPPLAVDKGTAVADLLAATGVTTAAFAGDDHGDLAAFAALGEWAAAQSGRRALRVAVVSEESPPGLRDGADLVVEGPEALAAALVRLADALTV
jgi:trehalose 6-phosphate phosphatase